MLGTLPGEGEVTSPGTTSTFMDELPRIPFTPRISGNLDNFKAAELAET
jgi:hypothetical protein